MQCLPYLSMEYIYHVIMSIQIVQVTDNLQTDVKWDFCTDWTIYHSDQIEVSNILFALSFQHHTWTIDRVLQHVSMLSTYIFLFSGCNSNEVSVRMNPQLAQAL